MKLRKLLLISVAAVLLYFIVTAPTAAAGTAEGLGNVLAEGANNVITFFTSLVS